MESMAGVTPRRSTRIPHINTPKMSERKKGLFQGPVGQTKPQLESLTKHRRLPVVDSESEDDECDLGIISTLDSSSCDEDDQDVLKTPERDIWNETRLNIRRQLKETHDLKNFLKSPFTLKKYQTRYSCHESKCSESLSTPATPHLNNHPGTPSSSHSTASVHTTSSTSSRARKSLASLIADTESCSSSLKDLNFDTDSDSKENTPRKTTSRYGRELKATPKLQSFKGILVEHKKNTPSKIPFVSLTKLDMSVVMSPTHMLKTPQNNSEMTSPPKLAHNRKSVLETEESPENSSDNDISYKRLRNDNSDPGPPAKYPKLDTTKSPKARVSLFNSDRLKEILSAKSFYGNSHSELNSNVIKHISQVVDKTHATHRQAFSHSRSSRHRRRPGQINSGVRHKIRKPKINKNKILYNNSLNKSSNKSNLNDTTISNTSPQNASILNQTSQELGLDKTDPFDNEKRTIDTLLSQWTEEEVPEHEIVFTKRTQAVELPCFNSTLMEDNTEIPPPVTAVPVILSQGLLQNSDAVIMEIGAQTSMVHADISPSQLERPTAESEHDVEMGAGHIADHGDVPKTGEFLPVEGGYILVENTVQDQEDLPDLDQIENELRMLDEQILQLAEKNNIDPKVVLASTEKTVTSSNAQNTEHLPEKDAIDKESKLFPIFSKPNPGTSTPKSNKGNLEKKKMILKDASDQYVIDAGQKKFGVTQCTECTVIYQIGDPQDEQAHLIHHNAVNVLRFNGWKDECIVGTWGNARCIRVRGGEAGWKRVETLLDRVVHPELGYGISLPGNQLQHYTAYLYIEKNKIVGCLVVEVKSKAHKYLPGDPDCCSEEEYSVKCGVSRVWTHINHRRRGVAHRLLDCARASFLYGDVIEVSQLAFSAPTPAGKAFAANYCGTPNFYVFLQ